MWREYQSVVTRRQFVLGRAAFMAAFARRPIFLTQAMLRMEATARANIEAEVQRLTAEAKQARWS